MSAIISAIGLAVVTVACIADVVALRRLGQRVAALEERNERTDDEATAQRFLERQRKWAREGSIPGGSQ